MVERIGFLLVLRMLKYIALRDYWNLSRLKRAELFNSNGFSNSQKGKIMIISRAADRRRIFDLIRKGTYQADIAIINGKLVNVHSSEIYDSEVAIYGGRITSVSGSVKDFVGSNTKVVDAQGKFLTPGMIDVHYHVAGTYLSMSNLADALLQRGTTAVAADFYEYGAVGGVEAIRFALKEAERTDLKILFNVPLLAYVQNDPFSNSRKIKASDLMEMLDWESAVALSEIQPQTLSDPSVVRLIEKAKKLRKTLVGHYVGFDEKGLSAWMAMGPSSDHESTQAFEAVSKIRQGIRIAVREGSAATDLSDVIKAITEHKLDPGRFMFCTDEIDPLELKTLGHMDFKVRKAVKLGVSPTSAIQMATINAAEYFNVADEIGSIAPGKIADIVISNNISDLKADTVIANGIVVAARQSRTKPAQSRYPKFMMNSISVARRRPSDFAIRTNKKEQGTVRANVIVAQEGLLISDRKIVDVQAESGEVLCDPVKDILKVSVVDRHGSNRIGNAFMSGFGLHSGAIAESFNPIPENIIAVGASNEDVAVSVNRIRELQGGFVVVENGKILAELHLPILGMMSEKPLDQVASELEVVMKSVRKLGCNLKSPFLTLMFMGYPLIPTLKITEKGLVDVDKMRYVDVLVD
jgi:adenine deaminase